MPAFEYTALESNGKQKKGIMDADSAKQLRQLLRDGGLIPLDVQQVEKSADQASNKQAQKLRPQGGTLKPAELALITRQLSTLVQSGSPIEEALATTVKQTDKRSVKRVMSGVRTRVMEGHSLAVGFSAFPKVFPRLYQATVAAGEKSGHLDAVLNRLADYTENRQVMQSKVQTAMFYPFVLTLLAILIVVGLLVYVVPKVIEVFDSVGEQLPLMTRILIAISDFVQQNGLFMLGGLIVGLFVMQKLLQIPVWRYRYDQFLLKLPLVGRLNRGFNTARFARTLSILANSGVPILEALTIAAQVIENRPMQKAVEEAAVKVREGSSIYKALEQSNYFPPMTVYLIASGEGSGNLDEMLERAAIQQERETDTLLATTLALFEPVLILVMGGVVLMIVLAILLPIMDLNQLVGQ
ncbi:MAG: type II secretion system inner membrane protein GspF [bacterium]